MKKLIGTLAAMALLAGAAFAEGITFGASGDFVLDFTNYADNDGDVRIGTTMERVNDPGTNNSFSLKGESENVGFAIDIQLRGEKEWPMWRDGDNALLWIKPFDWMRIEAAASNDTHDLRSNCGFGSWDWTRFGAIARDTWDGGGDGWIFPDTYGNTNFNVELTPIEGLVIGGGIMLTQKENTKGTATTEAAGGTAKDKYLGTDVKEVFGRGRIGVAYTIADIGTIKVGLKGYGKSDDDGNACTDDKGESKDLIVIPVGFEFTMIDDVYIGIGAHIPLGGTYYGNGNNRAVLLNLFGRVSIIENMNIYALLGFKFNNSDLDEGDKDGAVGFTVGAGVDYDFGSGVKAFFDVYYANGVYMNNTSADDNDSLALGLGVSKAYSNGSMGIGFMMTTNGGLYAKSNQLHATSVGWTIPLKFGYSF